MAASSREAEGRASDVLYPDVRISEGVRTYTGSLTAITEPARITSNCWHVAEMTHSPGVTDPSSATGRSSNLLLPSCLPHLLLFLRNKRFYVGMVTTVFLTDLCEASRQSGGTLCMAPLSPKCGLPLFSVWFWRMAFRNEPGRLYDHCLKRSTVDIGRAPDTPVCFYLI